MQIITEFVTTSGQTIAVQAPTVSVIQTSTPTTTFLTVGGNQIEVMGDYATVKNQIATAS